MTVPFLDVGAGYRELRVELDEAFDRVMNSGRYILGEELEAFESEFASFCGVRHAIGVGNGLEALSLALRARDIGPGDEVIVPAHTFIATWLAVERAGATIVPVDVDDATLLIDAEAVAAAVTGRTAAILPVHLYGCPADMEALEALCTRQGLLLLGDAAQAHGALCDGRDVGALGDVAAFSFYPAKNLGAFGDGGALTTNDDAIAARAARLRNYGSAAKHEFSEMGENSRLDPLQAAFLRVKLRALKAWNKRRSVIAERYMQSLGAVSALRLPQTPDRVDEPAWHLYCVRHPERDALADHLRACGIETQIHYPIAPHRTPAFAHMKLEAGSFPITEAATDTLVSLPIGPHLDDDSVDAVIEAVVSYR
jgi:dTDP-3-amino-3,4,6-trideoxy-alpha-D-glucose transaminase